MTGPGDNTAAAGGRRDGHLRASRADREQVIDTLKAAFAQGMLAKDGFDLRVGQALGSRTYAELAALTADLPAGPAAAQPPQPARAQGQPRAVRPGLVITVATVLYVGAWALAFVLPRSGPDHDPHAGVGLAGVATLFYLLVLIMAGTQMLGDWADKRSGRQPPRGPASGAGGQASRRLPSAGPGGELPPVDGGQQHTAEAVRSRLPRQQSIGSWPPHRWRYRGRGHTIGYVGD